MFLVKLDNIEEKEREKKKLNKNKLKETENK